MRLLPTGERVDDLVRCYGDPIEVMTIERIGNRAYERRCTGAHDGLADAL